ncbi:hypothetical protein [Permianibacter aggregans]|uniref:Uncharacterized protein n=1 Tax=Permianibacter aggregans TaxID=1510150 RepID=A0A4R6UQ62_9GAMM|nr:hypothetical protein [Permianibacter aggregans]QGX40113.1 hypothetical protein E2H98_10705 [Permianibacter aggregans]TDQ49072.1 hypothetical protein EV696_10546 [Permianibacter aggregans]
MSKYLVVALSLVALSSQAEQQAWQQCAVIQHNDARLACYDAYARSLSSTHAPKIVEEMPAPVVATQPGATAVVVPAKPVERVQPEIVKPEVVKPESNEKTFGLEQKIIAEQQVEEIVTRFDGKFTGWEPKQEITLANGQVWQISDNSSAHHYVDNPEITIKRGMFGSFYMKIEGLNRSPKVKRIK